MTQQTQPATDTAAAPVPAGRPAGGEDTRETPLTRLRHRLRSGELGPLPVLIGLLVICAVFQSLNSSFLTPQNLSNLALQVVSTGLMSTGVIMVLLLGEIDLSIGSVSGVCGAVLAVLAVHVGLPEVAAIAVAVLTGLVIGIIHGTIFAKIGVPAFVVTLAGLLGWQGAQLYLLRSDGTINIPYEGPIASLTQTFFVPGMGWAMGVAVVGLFLTTALWGRRRRTRVGLPARSTAEIIVRTTLLAVAVLGAVWVLNLWKGVPLALLIFVGFVVAFDLMLRKTRYGRMVFAVGGNAEAARRAGINVDLIRISVFALASMLAGIGGIMFVSRGFAVSQATGSGEVLMLAIAAAVIGGTSLFGGRGSAYSALLGGLVLGAITSGLYLLQMDSSVRYMITAAVLLVAVVLDAMSRRSRQVHARGG